MNEKNIIFRQALKHLIVGGFAVVIDVVFFELFIMLSVAVILAKAISFLISVVIKYIGNKYWAFQKNSTDNIYMEIMQFLAITFLGLAIDVSAFYYFTQAIGPQLDITESVWLKLGVIFAAGAAAAWNFLGYKFLVFKK